MPLSETVMPMTRSRTLQHVSLLALAVGFYAAVPVWKEHSRYRDIGDTPSEIHAALALVLGWLLVFRTNTAYERWWEARTLWGMLVNASRNIAVKCSRLVELPDQERSEVHRVLVGFPYALRDHLRDEAALQNVPGFELESGTPGHVPAFLTARLYNALGRWRKAGWIDGDDLRVIDRDLARLLDICGGCERIRRTRLARSYRVFARQCVVLFLLTFPWGIVDDFNWWTVPLTAITAYFMLGLEIVAEHVEEPFGYDEDDLDLDSMCKSIAQSVDEIITADVRPA